VGYVGRASLVVLALVGASVVPTTAAARLHGRIVFASDRRANLNDEGQAIWTMRADGTHARRLTQLHGGTANVLDSQPDWSPSGRQIVFTRSDHGHESLWLMTDQGRRLHRLASDAEAPAWSPTGDWIAFNRPNQNGYNATVWLVHPDGSQPHPIGEGNGPAWSPDGKRLVAEEVQSDEEGGVAQAQLDVFGLDGSGRQTIFTSPDRGQPHSPAWSPNGRRIVFTREFFAEEALGELWSVPSAGGEATLLTRNADRASFAPNGGTIVFETERRVGGPFGGSGFLDGLDVIDADGRHRRRLAGQKGWIVKRASLADPDWHR
jgi:Tol biopolymer transport system component